MATHSSVLAWRIPGIGEPGGLPSIGLHSKAVWVFLRGATFLGKAKGLLYCFPPVRRHGAQEVCQVPGSPEFPEAVKPVTVFLYLSPLLSM